MYVQMPATKRQRTSISSKNELLYPFELCYTNNKRNKNKTTVQINKIPKCSLIGVMKYLDDESLNTLTKTSTIMHDAAIKYKKYKQKLNAYSINENINENINDIIMNDLDINTTDNNTNMTSLSLSLSIPTLDNEIQVPSLSLKQTQCNNNNNNYNNNSNNNNIMKHKNNTCNMDIYNHLTINSHLNLNLNNNEHDDSDSDIDIDIFEKNRCSLLDILNNMENITI